MKSCYISMQHYAAVNHICNALKHDAEVNVYGENEKAINMADEVIQRYERINAILKDALADVPKCLWGIYCVKASIY